MSSSFNANRSTPRSEDKTIMQSRSNYTQRQEERKSQPVNKTGRGGDRNNTNRTHQQSQINDKPTSQTSTSQDANATSTTAINTNNNSNNNRRNERPARKEREQTPRQSVGGYQGNKRNNEYNITDNKPSYPQREPNNKTNKPPIVNSKTRQDTQVQQPIQNDDKDMENKPYQQRKYKLAIINPKTRQEVQMPEEPAQKTNNFEKALDNLVDTTSKMSIQTKKESTYNNQQQNRGRNQQNSRGNNQQATPHPGQQQPAESYNSNTQQQQHATPSQHYSSKSQPQQARVVQAATSVPSPQPAAYVAQLGNGFAYDPSKIMGFQSKEANEYAMNLLKSQGLTMQQLQQQQQAASQQTQQVPTLPPQQQHPQAQILNAQAPPPAAVAYMAQNPNLYVAPPQQAPPQFGMMSGGNWPWKIGDLCLAKYWDDGNVSVFYLILIFN